MSGSFSFIFSAPVGLLAVHVYRLAAKTSPKLIGAKKAKSIDRYRFQT
jgi:hypothetical protein